MRNGVGVVQRVLLVGGTSEIGLAILRALRPTGEVLLAGRDPVALEDAAEGLRREGIGPVRTMAFVAGAGHVNDAALTRAAEGGDIDVVVVAVGELGSQESSETDVARAVSVATSTYVGALEGALIGARLLRPQGHGALVVISSAAAMRPRRSNFIYGSAKAGADFLTRGLQDALRGSGVQVLLVRPGFVSTRMTAGLAAAPLAQTPEQVGQRVARALRRGESRAYSPPALRYVMGILVSLPGPIFRRLPL